MEVFPSATFGTIAYFQLLAKAKSPVIECKEHFVKQTLRSRYKILGPNGVQTLTIPVHKVNGSKTQMDEVLCEDSNWATLHWRAIKTGYAASPYLENYQSEIKALLFHKERNLIARNKLFFEKVNDWLDLQISPQYSEKYIENVSFTDYRNSNFELSDEDCIKYRQVFCEKENFVPNLSILDVVLNHGPMARNWII